MLTTLALLTSLALAPTQPGDLTINNPHFTVGYFGATRKSASFLPGDVVFLAVEVGNVKLNKAGKATCGLALELVDAKGKTMFKQNPRNEQAQCCLGGAALFSVATEAIPKDQAAGEYTVKLTVHDV